MDREIRTRSSGRVARAVAQLVDGITDAGVSVNAAEGGNAPAGER